MHHRLGGPLPRQLANAPQIHLSASCPDFNRKKMPPLYLSGISRRFHPLSRSHRQVVYVLLTRSPLLPHRAGSVLQAFDLHVLGMPPAFILSQDQTLHCLSVSFFYAVVSSVFSFFIRTSIGPSELTFPVWFSKIGLTAFRCVLSYIITSSLPCQCFFLLFVNS